MFEDGQQVCAFGRLPQAQQLHGMLDTNDNLLTTQNVTGRRPDEMGNDISIVTSFRFGGGFQGLNNDVSATLSESSYSGVAEWI